MALDIELLRSQTPGLAQVTHLNSAGASLVPQAVLDCQIAYLQREAAIGGYEAAAEVQAPFEKVYRSIAKLIKADPEEIALVENATLAWQLAFFALPLKEGERILTAEAEYASNYINYLKLKRDRGIEIEVIPSDESGQLDVAALEAMIDERVKLITITHIPTSGGLINPAEEVGKIARRHGITYLLDACQSVGQIDINVEAIGCDFLSATGRKYLRGPRGTGFLYVRKSQLETIEPPFLDLHAARWVARDRYALRPDARRFENWEFNYANQLGLGCAVDYALDLGMGEIETRVIALGEKLREALSAESGIEVKDIGRRKGGLVTFTKEGFGAEAIKQHLTRSAINVSTSTTASTRIDLEKRGIAEMVRASLHYYNDESDMERLIEALRSL